MHPGHLMPQPLLLTSLLVLPQCAKLNVERKRKKKKKKEVEEDKEHIEELEKEKEEALGGEKS